MFLSFSSLNFAKKAQKLLKRKGLGCFFGWGVIF